MFATDRDLLALEPNLFRDVGWVSQRLVSGVGSISGTTLTLTSQDVTFSAAGVGAGYVVLVDGAPYEVLARTGSTTLTVSRLRDDPAGDAITPSPVTSKTVYVVTFRPQIALVHRQVLCMLGIDPDASGGGPTEASVTNPGSLRLIETLGALHLIYLAATAPDAGWTEHTFSRVRLYQERYAAERQRAVAQIDLDGDGVPDATRRLNVLQFLRV